MTKKEIREIIEHLLRAAGWSVQDYADADFKASPGVVLQNFPLARDYGTMDYLLLLEGKAMGLIELSLDGRGLKGIALDTEKYRRGLPFTLKLFTRPLPFLYQSSAREILFTNTFDPEPRARNLQGFHKPETLKLWLEDGMVGETPRDMAAEFHPEHRRRGRSFHERLLINMPKLATGGLSFEQTSVLENIEAALQKNHRRLLIEMEAGHKREGVQIYLIDRLLRFADARRVLFLFETRVQMDHAFSVFQKYISPYSPTFLFEHFSCQILESKGCDTNTRICFSTLSELKGLQKSGENKEASLTGLNYNPSIPIECFDVIVIDECPEPLDLNFCRTLEYFDTVLIGFSAKADEKTIGFFNQNVIKRHRHRSGESDGLNMI